jgi:uncharacterized iron-regulated protein
MLRTFKIMRTIFFTLGFSFCLMFWSVPGLPAAVASSSPGFPDRSAAQSALLKRMVAARIIYLGETHDRPEDHIAQLEILQQLHRRNPKLAIALEMVQRPYQRVLDLYLSGAISEVELRAQTEYDRRWSFDWAFYAPIFRFAKANQIPLVALNTPSEILRKVSRSGLASLTGIDYKWIPKRADLELSNGAYRQRLREIYDSFHKKKGKSAGFERFVEAQVLWDETMAEAIALYVRSNPERQVVVLAGQGHLLYGDGIPSRVQRRLIKMGKGDWPTLNVLLNPPADFLKPQPRPIADGFWQTMPTPDS